MNLIKLRRDVMLAPYTTYGIGGSSDYFIEASSIDELVEAIVWARHDGIPYFVLGKGSNILVSDKGYRGVVICNRAAGCEFKDQSLIVESGATIGDLLPVCSERGLSGMEHFAGIPSTVGGAIWQNLHFLSPDRSRTMFIAEIVESATVLMPDNTVKEVRADFFKFGYDESILHYQDIVVLAVTFTLELKPRQEIEHQSEQNLEWRRQRQPQVEDWPSCGSVFKQIEGVGAGRLIDQVGLKGKQIGGAQISPLHANFIVNTGGATAKDVLDLARLAQSEVKIQLGFDLETEIGLVGDF